jgi:hypothetical protein
MKTTTRNISVWNKKTITVLFALFIFTMPLLAQETTKDKSDFTKDTCKILFIGSSYFNYNNLPNLFENLTDYSGNEVYIDQYIPSGLYLSDHANSSITESKINEKDWDYIILQGVGRITAYPEFFTDHPVYPALETLQNKISKNCESTKMVFCLPWAYEDGMTWYGWPDTYADMQMKIYENTLQYSNDLDFPIAPVGWAWYAVLEEENYPLHYLHMSDWNHPSLKGSYLMACVIFSAIFQESSVGNTYYAGLPEEEASYFQTVASNIVLDSLDLWNISANTDIDESSALFNFQLSQNHPNPFSSCTQINYEIQKKSFVEISVYDIFGKRYSNLVNEYKLQGNYSVNFNGSNLKNGVYFYKMKIENCVLTRKMVLLN